MSEAHTYVFYPQWTAAAYWISDIIWINMFWQSLTHFSLMLLSLALHYNLFKVICLLCRNSYLPFLSILGQWSSSSTSCPNLSCIRYIWRILILENTVIKQPLRSFAFLVVRMKCRCTEILNCDELVQIIYIFNI